QNADGGFGHALEPDLRLPGSSVITTTVAFQRLREIHAPANDPIVVNGCRYLRETYDAATINWEIMPKNVDDAPHAPWWTYGTDLSHNLSNPRAEVLGYLYDYAEHFPATMRQQVTDAVIEHLITKSDTLEMSGLHCAVRLYETETLPEAIKTRLLVSLKAAAERLVVRDPSQWAEYGLPPLSLVNSPESPFAPLFQQDLAVNLDYAIDQLVDGSYWTPNWSWFGLWSDVWPQAEKDWRGVITLGNLGLLRAFGRLN